MPLNEGAKPGSKGFGENIATEIKAGKPAKQAEAIAYSEAGEKNDMTRPDFGELRKLLSEFFEEEAREPEHQDSRMDALMAKADASKKNDVPPASHLLKEKATDRLWKITGVSMSGGRPVTVKVRAANYNEVRQNAARRGIRVESVILQDGQ